MTAPPSPPLPPLLLTDTVQLLDRVRTGTDDRGNDVFTDGPTPLTGVSVQPRMNVESATGRQDFVTDKWRMFGPPNIGLAAKDHLRWNGIGMEVDGTPMEWRGAGLDHSETDLIRWTG